MNDGCWGWSLVLYGVLEVKLYNPEVMRLDIIDPSCRTSMGVCLWTFFLLSTFLLSIHTLMLVQHSTAHHREGIRLGLITFVYPLLHCTTYGDVTFSIQQRIGYSSLTILRGGTIYLCKSILKLAWHMSTHRRRQSLCGIRRVWWKMHCMVLEGSTCFRGWIGICRAHLLTYLACSIRTRCGMFSTLPYVMLQLMSTSFQQKRLCRDLQTLRRRSITCWKQRTVWFPIRLFVLGMVVVVWMVGTLYSCNNLCMTCCTCGRDSLFSGKLGRLLTPVQKGMHKTGKTPY